MTRFEFLKSLGFSGAALLVAMTSCIHEEDTVVDALTLAGPQSTTPASSTTATPSSGTVTTPGTSTTTSGTDLSTIASRLLTIDLTSSAATALKTVGGYLAQSGIVVAQVSAGVYVAVTQTCSHEPKKKIIFNKTEFYCTEHGARFDLTGKGKNSFGSKGITVYKTATDGKTLVVYNS
ncbi:Rieske 2Fe-2S domain-containing protein [Larkinella humicola]|uniref:Rieske 2Fe-2S domain-containing protein n=1 Tax=Larkinella humicola TaxID=2607654 RepID=A0A5N1JLW7_9BACT|nr:Rieske 2Fe-2S domain-containing protein [Larkinella humicola]KAA9357500.1 Rieske 2Fe-2S domain-containing protein [Larkinella humicola]